MSWAEAGAGLGAQDTGLHQTPDSGRIAGVVGAGAGAAVGAGACPDRRTFNADRHATAVRCAFRAPLRYRSDTSPPRVPPVRIASTAAWLNRWNSASSNVKCRASSSADALSATAPTEASCASRSLCISRGTALDRIASLRATVYSSGVYPSRCARSPTDSAPTRLVAAGCVRLHAVSSASPDGGVTEGDGASFLCPTIYSLLRSGHTHTFLFICTVRRGVRHPPSPSVSGCDFRCLIPLRLQPQPREVHQHIWRKAPAHSPGPVLGVLHAHLPQGVRQGLERPLIAFR